MACFTSSLPNPPNQTFQHLARPAAAQQALIRLHASILLRHGVVVDDQIDALGEVGYRVCWWAELEG